MKYTGAFTVDLEQISEVQSFGAWETKQPRQLIEEQFCKHLQVAMIYSMAKKEHTYNKSVHLMKAKDDGEAQMRKCFFIRHCMLWQFLERGTGICETYQNAWDINIHYGEIEPCKKVCLKHARSCCACPAREVQGHLNCSLSAKISYLPQFQKNTHLLNDYYRSMVAQKCFGDKTNPTRKFALVSLLNFI